MRTIVVMIVTAAALAIPDTAANARGSRDTHAANATSLVACPPSICNPRGGQRARNINLCKASNCGR